MRSCRGLESRAVALAFQQGNGATGEALGVTTIIVISAQFSIGGALPPYPRELHVGACGHGVAEKTEALGSVLVRERIHPVRLPPGCAMLLTKPHRIGSPRSANTTGMERVLLFFAACATGVAHRDNHSDPEADGALNHLAETSAAVVC